jgi:hypothetical protein
VKCLVHGTILAEKRDKGRVQMTMVDQHKINENIEMLFMELVKNARISSFQEVIQQNISTKRESATSQEDFHDRLMLNIAYFVENKKIWNELMIQSIISETVVARKVIEANSIQGQMVIREKLATQMEDYKEIFHEQYKKLNVTTEDIIYDYAYASVEHSLRFDFLLYLADKQAAVQLKDGELQETIRVIDGYVAYFTDQLVNQMELK